MPSPKESKYEHNFVSQEQINTLLKGSGEFVFPDGEDPLGDIADFIDTDEIDRLLGDDDPEDADDPYREDEMTDELPSEDNGFDDDELSMISMDDIQRVLSEDNREEPEEELLEELDLNLEELVAAPEEEGDLISQDDIERLLQNSGVQDDLASEGIDEGFQISREEIDTILMESQDAPETRDEEILRQAPPAPVEEEDDELPPEEPRSMKKLFLVAAGFLLLFIAGGTAGWFFILEGGQDGPPVARIAGTGEEMVGDPDHGAVSGEPQVVSRLEDFLIPAPEGNDYAFVSMHVVLTIRGVKHDPIKGYETFYRKRIYDEMVAKLATLSGEKPVERDLRELVRKTAGTILTEGVIDEVALQGYRFM